MRTQDEQLYRDLEIMREQIRALNAKNSQLEQRLSDSVADLNAQIFQNVPPVVNYVNNGDFVFEQEDYVPGTNYVGDDTDCAQWYFKTVATSLFAAEHTTTVRSTDQVDTNTARQAWWAKTSGEITFGLNAKLGHPLSKNLAFPASSLFCRFQIKKSSGAIAMTDTWRLRASIWDNTSGQSKILEGAPFDLTATPAVPAPGAFTRKYLLRVETPMDFFFSDVITPVQVLNQVSVSGTDNVNFVNVEWQNFPESSKYKLYRHDSEFNEWRLIAEIVNGATAFKDVGGRTGALLIPPVANILPKAQALFVNFGLYVNSNLNYQEVLFNIFVPSNYNYGLTTAKQYLYIDVVDENLVPITLPANALVLDKVGLGYTNGRFTYSAQDLQANATVAATAPPPTPPPGGEDGDGGNRPPPRGRGDSPFCVHPDTLILVEGEVWKKAKEVREGENIVNEYGLLSKVSEVRRGTTSQFRVITTHNGRHLWCSPSHKILTGIADREGTPAFQLKVGGQVMAWDEKYKVVFDTIEAIEVIEVPDDPVITFKLEGEHTYIAAGIVSHNLKPALEL